MKHSKKERTDMTAIKEWKVLEQRIYPHTINVHLTTRRGTYSFATMQMEIHESVFDKGQMIEHRIRHTTTNALYLHEHPELELAFEVVGRGQAILENALLFNMQKQGGVKLERVGQEGYWIIKEKDEVKP